MGSEKLERHNWNKRAGLALGLVFISFTIAAFLQISFVLIGPTKKSCSREVCIKKFLEGPPSFNDERLKSYLQRNHFHRSNFPSQYKLHQGYSKFHYDALNVILDHFGRKKKGTFAVLGAGDGEYRDLTLPLEAEYGWTGFLVEPNPHLFEELQKKGRNALLSNTCVSPFPHPTMVPMVHRQVDDDEPIEKKFAAYRMSTIKALNNHPKEVKLAKFKAQCVPLENLLYAADLHPKLDLLILDMSGGDMDVLSNVKDDALPETEMKVVISNGAELSPDIDTFFLEEIMELSKTIGTINETKFYFFNKFKNCKYFKCLVRDSKSIL